MNRIDYDLLRMGRPELKLPPWPFLREDWQELLGKLSVERLVARRTARILMSDHPPRDDRLCWLAAPKPEAESPF